MSKMVDDVRAFLLASGGEQPQKHPVIPSPDVAKLWASLRGEELKEFSSAIDDLYIILNAAPLEIHKAFANFSKELVDVLYVFIGTALRYGIPLDAVWDEVQRSNMAKVSGNVRRRNDGKILKPEGWTPPDILSIITRAGE